MAAISRGGCYFPCDPTIPAQPSQFNSSDHAQHKTKTTDIAHQRRQRLIGIALMCGAVALFACLDTTAKYLNTQMDAMQITWARYTSAFVLTLIVSNPLTHTGLLRTGRLKLQIARSLLLVVCDRAEFPGAALAAARRGRCRSSSPFRSSSPSPPGRCWANGSAGGAGRAICFGFGGVLLITRPGFGGMHPAALLSLAATVCYGFYAVITRIVSRVDSNQTSLFYSNFIGALVMLPVIPFVWQTPSNWVDRAHADGDRRARQRSGISC